MFINPEEITTHLYDYQVEQITDGSVAIVDEAIATAVEEVKAYLANRYDTDAIFAKEGSERNPLVLRCCKTVAAYHLLLLCNVDAIYEKYEKAYTKTIEFLNRIANGHVTVGLPYREADDGTAPGTIQINSNRKFKHQF